MQLNSVLNYYLVIYIYYHSDMLHLKTLMYFSGKKKKKKGLFSQNSRQP